jgi:hypoxanthine phosphoribosyltransferase
MGDAAPIGRAPAWRAPIHTLHDADALATRIAELGRQITQDYAGRDLTVVAVLKGSFPFFADLVRHIDLPLTCEFIGISSYGDNKSTSGVVKITFDLTHSIEGKDVLIVEDIIDSGLSMQYLLRNFAQRLPRSVAVCTLLHKPSGARVEVPIAYKGFTIGNAFVVGYGLDYHGRLRNLPYVGVVVPGQEGALEATLSQVGDSTALAPGGFHETH